MNTYELLKIGSATLKENKIVSFILDSEILLSKVLQKNRQDLLLSFFEPIFINSKAFINLNFRVSNFVLLT